MRLETSRLQQLSPLSDCEVAARVVGGDSGAFELLMRRHNERLYRTARGVLMNDADAQDALQDAYIRIYNSLGGFEERASLVTWMTRVVFNESLRFRGRRARIRERERTGDVHVELERSTATTGDAMTISESVRMFDDAMETLTDSERSVVMLRVVQGLSTRETAASLGMSESNVKVTLFRARPKLAAAIDASNVEDVRRALAFDGERCDRLVASVFRRLDSGDGDALCVDRR